MDCVFVAATGVCVCMRQLGPHKMRNWGVPITVVKKMDREFCQIVRCKPVEESPISGFPPCGSQWIEHTSSDENTISKTYMFIQDIHTLQFLFNNFHTPLDRLMCLLDHG
jgi:hypothetical protein